MSEENKYPSYYEQGKNLGDLVWNVLKSAISDPKALLASAEVKKQRLETCYTCEFFVAEDRRCSECGCWVDQKASVALDSCPKDKWLNDNDTFIEQHYERIIKDLDENPDKWIVDENGNKIPVD